MVGHPAAASTAPPGRSPSVCPTSAPGQSWERRSFWSTDSKTLAPTWKPAPGAWCCGEPTIKLCAGMLTAAQGDIVNWKNPTENAATDTPHSTVLDMESLRTPSIESAEGPTSLPMSRGPVARPISATGDEITPARSGALSDQERIQLARIKKDRRNGWMPTFTDFDFLLELTERLKR